MSGSLSVKDLMELVGEIDIIVGEDYLDRLVTVPDLYRPSLELAGYMIYYPKERVQLLGLTELSYAETLDEKTKIERFEYLCDEKTPAFFISRNLVAPQELIDAAQSKKIPILASSQRTTQLSSRVTNVLETMLADRKSIHGVLVDINGMGVLIQGASGIGKSETALDLVQRGHRLVADDRVDLYTSDDVIVYGEAPEVTRHMMEIRGIGVIDLVQMFGVGAVRDRSRIDLIVRLELWDKRTQYDRLGLEINRQRIFDIEIPSMIIPVSPGRNLSIIIETAAMSVRAKNLGYDATETLMRNMDKLMAQNAQKKKQ